MAVRIGENDAAIFEWLGAGQSWTARQLGILTHRSESNTRRRLGQLASAGLVTSSPIVEGADGRPERDYYVTGANLKKLRDVAPWIDIRAMGRRKPASIPHHRCINEFWSCLHVALEPQDYYEYRLFPSCRYDAADPDAPTCIRAPNRRHRSSSDRGVIADCTLVVTCPAGSSLAYVEIDIGTEPLDSPLVRRSTLLAKLEAYATFHDSQGYTRLADQLGEKFSGFRVLVVTSSPRRAANIRTLCARIGSSDFIWLTTPDQIAPDKILGCIWQTGEDRTLRPLLKQYPSAADASAKPADERRNER